MFKDKIILNSDNLIDIYGEDNEKIKLIKSYFPELNITARGVELILQGNRSRIDNFKNFFSKIIDYVQHYDSIDKCDIERLISNESQKISDCIVNFSLIGSNGIVIKPKTINQRRMIALSQENKMLFVSGPAGTGKTYTAIALAAQAFKTKQVKKIILTRPAVEAGENLGFLPGDLFDKLSPYMQPLYDALGDIFDQKKLDLYLSNNQIEIVPLAFMRGRTLDNAFVILDEAQNTTVQQMKMFLTRMGISAQFIICGDISQVDLPKNQKSGLLHAQNILNSIDGIGMIKFDDKDIIRHELVKSIIKAYKK